MSLALRHLTILIVDGDADYCQHVRSLLETSGASVMVAGFKAYVPKSIEPTCIVNAITSLLSDSTDLAA